MLLEANAAQILAQMKNALELLKEVIVNMIQIVIKVFAALIRNVQNMLMKVLPVQEIQIVKQDMYALILYVHYSFQLRLEVRHLIP